MTVPEARTLFTNSGAPVFSYGVPDCFSDSTCGDTEPPVSQSHTGTVNKTNFENQLSTIANQLNNPALILQMFPVNYSANGVVDGTSFCPTLNNNSAGTATPSSDEWGLDLPYDKAVIDAVVASGISPSAIFVESSNEAENQCHTKWGYSSTVQPGVSTALGHMFAAVMDGPSGLRAYLRSKFPNAITADIGYIGTAGGLNRGSTPDTCVSQAGKPYGYNCTYNIAKSQIDDFNNAVKADQGTSGVPDIESIHSYCHSSDFSPSAGYPLDDNKCFAYYREWITMAHLEAHNIWGATAGDPVMFGITEWQAGVCTADQAGDNAQCWSKAADGISNGGFINGTANDASSYDSGFWSMLGGSNAQLTGLTGTRYYLGVQFDDAGNADGQGVPGAPDNNNTIHGGDPAGNYNVIQKAGTAGEGYSAFCNATGVGTGC